MLQEWEYTQKITGILRAVFVVDSSLEMVYNDTDLLKTRCTLSLQKIFYLPYLFLNLKTTSQSLTL